MYYLLTKLKQMHLRLGDNNKCPIKEANLISFIYLTQN